MGNFAENLNLGNRVRPPLWLDLVWLIPILQPIRMIDIWNYVIVYKLGNSRVINDDL